MGWKKLGAELLLGLRRHCLNFEKRRRLRRILEVVADTDLCSSAPGAPYNAANRIAAVTDASGSVQRAYDVQGNVVREVRVLTPPNEVNEPFKFIPAGQCVTCTTTTTQCVTCFGGWNADSSLSLTGTGSGWGRYGLSTGGTCSTCSQGQWVGWGTADDHSLESKAMPLTYVTQYVYDTWGRVQQMTYPDGEVLTYGYDSGGLPRMVTGMIPKGNLVFPYVLRLEYDKFEQRVFVQNGNGTQSQYAYDPQNRRLSQLQGQTGSGTGSGKITFQNLHYGYDSVGNVTSLSNQIAPMPGFLLGGPVTQTFQYDDLYRLTHASGNISSIYDPSCGSTYDSTYSLDMSYDVIHNILEKKQAASFTQVDNSNHLTTLGPDSRLTYDWKYRYDGVQPHAPTQIGQREYYYDDNGNQTGYEVLPTDGDPNDSSFGVNRNIVWDEENRMVAVGDNDPGVLGTNGGSVHFVYNDQGTRVFKIHGGQISAYINQFYTIQNLQKDPPTNGQGYGHVATKHIFVGSQRIASQIVNPKNDHEFDSGQGDGHGFHNGDYGLGHGWKWGDDEDGWNHFCEHQGKGGEHEGDDDQIQFVTALSDGVTVFRKMTDKSDALGTLLGCQTATLLSLKTFNGYYVIDYKGQRGYVSSASVTAGIPDSCVGVSPTSSVLPQDDFVFFYHSDHLGSTGYMTDGAGRITEHLEYIPFGETWIEAHQGMQLFPNYEFSAKELDEETGLYYFGARYYDPRTSVWQSADPALGKFLPNLGFDNKLVFKDQPDWTWGINLPQLGGVFNSINLASYTYAADEPLRYVDPDGKDYILLNDQGAARGAGHNAALVGSDAKGWIFFQKGGYGSSSEYNLAQPFKTLHSFQTSDLSKRFNRAYRVVTSAQQDRAMKGYGVKNFDKPYSVFSPKEKSGENCKENCADLAGEIGQAANQNAGSDSGEVSATFPKMGGITIPNEQYSNFVKQNPGQEIKPRVDSNGP